MVHLLRAPQGFAKTSRLGPDGRLFRAGQFIVPDPTSVAGIVRTGVVEDKGYADAVLCRLCRSELRGKELCKTRKDAAARAR